MSRSAGVSSAARGRVTGGSSAARGAGREVRRLGREAWDPSGEQKLLADEFLAVAHHRPDVGLDIRLQLAEVVAIVVHPLVHEVLHADVAHYLVRAPSREVRL